MRISEIFTQKEWYDYIKNLSIKLLNTALNLYYESDSIKITDVYKYSIIIKDKNWENWTLDIDAAPLSNYELYRIIKSIIREEKIKRILND